MCIFHKTRLETLNVKLRKIKLKLLRKYKQKYQFGKIKLKSP